MSSPASRIPNEGSRFTLQQLPCAPNQPEQTSSEAYNAAFTRSNCRAHWIGIILISGRPAEILQVNPLLLAGPEDGGSDDRRGDRRKPRLRQNSDSVRAGSRDQKHQFDLGRNPP